MSKKTGKRSTWGAAKAGVSRVLAPWGKPLPKTTARRTNAAGQSVAKTKRPSGSSMRRPTPDASLRGMNYPKNDPLQWPLESPSVRSDLNKPSGMDQDKADFNNDAVNRAYQRGGYAG